MYRFYPVILMGKADPFTQFYPNGFTHSVKLTMPTLAPFMTKTRPMVHFIVSTELTARLNRCVFKSRRKCW